VPVDVVGLAVLLLRNRPARENGASRANQAKLEIAHLLEKGRAGFGRELGRWYRQCDAADDDDTEQNAEGIRSG